MSHTIHVEWPVNLAFQSYNCSPCPNRVALISTAGGGQAGSDTWYKNEASLVRLAGHYSSERYSQSSSHIYVYVAIAAFMLPKYSNIRHGIVDIVTGIVIP